MIRLPSRSSLSTLLSFTDHCPPDVSKTRYVGNEKYEPIYIGPWKGRGRAVLCDPHLVPTQPTISVQHLQHSRTTHRSLCPLGLNPFIPGWVHNSAIQAYDVSLRR